MSLDITTLRLLTKREKYEQLRGAVPDAALETHTRIILDDFGRWFREFKMDAIDFDTFGAWFKHIHPKVNDEAMAAFQAMFLKVKQPLDPNLEHGIVKMWVAAQAARDLVELLEKFQNGEEIDLGLAVRARMEEYDARVAREVKSPQVLDRIEDLLVAEENLVGIHWPLPGLNAAIKPLVGGDFVIIAMRPDKGKSTKCSHIATHAAPQIDKLWPDRKRTIAWLNNEGPGRRIVMRNFQSALNATTEQLVEWMHEKPSDAKYGSKVRELYASALGGRMGVLKVFDIHGWWHHEVEELLKEHDPALVIADMIDNIRFGGEVLNNGQRTDQLLEGMYQWGRMMAVKYDSAWLANSQLSADADGVAYPTLPQLKDSKTGKQGAADVILTGGAVNDPMLAWDRYWGTTKNKKAPTAARPLALHTMLDKDRGRYIEAPT